MLINEKVLVLRPFYFQGYYQVVDTFLEVLFLFFSLLHGPHEELPLAGELFLALEDPVHALHKGGGD